MTQRASCCCGQLEVLVRGDLPGASICHCFQCQKRTGSAFGLQAKFPEDRITINGQSQQYERRGEGLVTFSFCPKCGSTVYWRLDGLPGMVVIAVGTFANPNFPAPVFSVYEERIHSWVALPDSVVTHWD